MAVWLAHFCMNKVLLVGGRKPLVLLLNPLKRGWGFLWPPLQLMHRQRKINASNDERASPVSVVIENDQFLTLFADVLYDHLEQIFKDVNLVLCA